MFTRSVSRLKYANKPRGLIPAAAQGAWEMKGRRRSLEWRELYGFKAHSKDTCATGQGPGTLDVCVHLQLSLRLMDIDDQFYPKVSKRNQILMPTCLKTDGQGFSVE